MVAKQLITKGVKGVVEAIAPVAKELTGGDLALKAAVNADPRVMAIRAAKADTGGRGYGPGSPYRAKRPTQTLGPRSTIATRPNKMIAAYPDEKDKIERWMRQAYAYARDPKKGTKKYPLKGYRNYLGPDGRKWRPKPSQGAFEGYQLKGDDKQARAVITQRRANREKPWTKPDQQDLINDSLLKIGKEHLYDDLIALMIKDYNAAIKKLGGQTKGHFISLGNGGLDVAENFGPQAGRSTRSMVGGKLKIKKGNYAEKADSTVGFGAGKGIDNWDDYVRMKLSQLEG